MHCNSFVTDIQTIDNSDVIAHFQLFWYLYLFVHGCSVTWCWTWYKYNQSNLDINNLSSMKPVSPATQFQILSMLMDGKSAHSASLETCVNTSTITRLHKNHLPYIPVSSSSCPLKLSDTNIRHVSYLISSGKANTAVDVTKTLSTITSQSISTQTTQRCLKNYGLKWSKKSPYSVRSTGKHILTLLWHTSIGLWRTGRGLFGQMRPKLIV